GFDTIILVACEPSTDLDADLFEHVACRREEIAALSAENPGRFVGVWSVDPNTGAAGVTAAQEVLAEPWCVGLHNHTHSWNLPFDDDRFEDYYRLCAEHDVPFVMQAGLSGGDFPGECGRPGGIDRPATEFPSVRFVLSHTGWPWTTDTIARATTFDNVYIGTASWPLRHWPAELREFATGEGAAKVLYGSGFPTTGHRQAARQFGDAALTEGLDGESIARITSANARRVFTRLSEPNDDETAEGT
ncbi:MAG: amidohydrolase family protein, partial [Microthrixaceae bacterium]